MVKPLTTGETIARDLCEMDAPIDNIIEVDPVDVALRIDEEVFHLVETITTLQSKSAALVDAVETYFKQYPHMMKSYIWDALATFKGEK